MDILEKIDKFEGMQGPPFYREQRELFENNHTAPYAVKSQNAERLYMEKYNSCKYRTEFQRDRDRIIHSTAFRRLPDKTQVYMVLKGQNIRNRLSHTLELSQIARSIATYTGLNVDLVEAIALGHDLGHTPFGHAVEESLDKILENNCGFKHNYQSVLVVDFLERREFFSETEYGLNLTNYTRYGILRHTKLDKEIKIYNQERDNLADNKYKSIEAELVAKIDTVSYLCHDLDDAKTMNIFNDLRKIPNDHDELKEGLNKSIKIMEEVLNIKENKYRIDTDLSTLPTNLILKALIEDLINGTTTNIKKYQIDSLKKVQEFDGQIVQFDKFEKDFDNLKDLLYRFVYKSPTAQQMDTKARYIVEKLYNSFINNSEQLPHQTRELFEKAKNGDFEKLDRRDSGYRLTPERVICNYIAGMTDVYALENYKRMFSAEY